MTACTPRVSFSSTIDSQTSRNHVFTTYTASSPPRTVQIEPENPMNGCMVRIRCWDTIQNWPTNTSRRSMESSFYIVESWETGLLRPLIPPFQKERIGSTWTVLMYVLCLLVWLNMLTEIRGSSMHLIIQNMDYDGLLRRGMTLKIPSSSWLPGATISRLNHSTDGPQYNIQGFGVRVINGSRYLYLDRISNLRQWGIGQK